MKKQSILKLVKFIMALQIGLSLQACKIKNDKAIIYNPPSEKPIVVPDSHEEEGGISAGGGGTLPADPITEYQVLEIIANAKQFLRLYLQYETQFNKKSITDTDKYFYGEKNLLTQLESTDIEVLKDKPCLDGRGKEVDASIISSRSNTICISVKRIIPKLVEEVANKEIVALIVHELSHLLGADETEARNIQKWVAFSVKDISYREAEMISTTLSNFSLDTSNKLRTSDLQDEVESSIKTGNVTKLFEKLHSLERNLYSYDDELMEKPWRFINYPIKGYQELITSKLLLMMNFINSIDESNNNSKIDKEEYEACFNGGEQIKVKDLPKNCRISLILDDDYPEYVFNKIHNLTEVKEELKEVIRFVEDLNSRIWSLAHNNSLPYFHLPNNKKENPWSRFVGKYQAQEVYCKSGRKDGANYFNGLSTIEIEKVIDANSWNINDKVSITENRKNFYSTDVIYDGSTYQSGNVHLEGDENNATMTSEYGTKWYEVRNNKGWSLTTKKITTTENGELLLTLRSERSYNDRKGLEQESYECQYSLQKVN